MGSKQTVIIGSKEYDSHTGLLVNPSPSVSSPHHTKQAVPSSAIHAATQRSLTLKRAIVKKMVKPHAAVLRSNMRRSADIIRVKKIVQKSPHVTRFAPHPVVIPLQKTPPQDIVAVKHPSLARAHQKLVAQNKPTSKGSIPSSVIRQQVVASALTATHLAQEPRLNLKKRFPRLFSLGSASLAVLILAGYLTYLNLPTISIHVAAAHAGIDATYPDYRPDGYRLSGLIASSDGEVSMQFAANAGPQNFTIKEARSGWDSTAVLENYIKPKTAGEYVTYNENGLTIYTYDTNAAWVNGGILYTINGDAPLSNEQIRRIATSL